MVVLFGSDLNNYEKLSNEDLKLKKQMFQYKAINSEAMLEYRQLIDETKKAPTSGLLIFLSFGMTSFKSTHFALE